MDRHFKNFAEIDDKTKNWTAKVKVLEKMFPKSWTKTRTGTSQTLILVDSQGDRIQATIFGRDIPLYQNTLLPFHKYYISNADVQLCPDIHRIVPSAFQWIISGRTLVENAPADFEMRETTHFNFVPFHEIDTYLFSDKLIDIRAIVARISPVRQVKTNNGPATVQELTLVNNELQEVMLTMWDNFVTNEGSIISDMIQSHPVILGMRLKVVSFKGVSLSTRGRSSFLINPAIPEIATLELCRTENAEALQRFTDPTANASGSTSTQMKPISISNIPQLHLRNTDELVVKASASIKNFDQDFYYIGCSACNRLINAECQTKYYCNHCHNNVTAEAKCRFEAELEDDTGTMIATIFTASAKKIFDCTAEELMAAEHKVPKNTSTAKKFVIKLKAYIYKIRDQTHQKYTVISAEDAGEARSET